MSARGALSWALGIAGMLCLTLGLALSGFECVALNDAVYLSLTDQLQVYDQVGVSREQTANALSDIRDYLSGERDGFNSRVEMFGQTQWMFNEREISHMRDVKRLFELERLIRRALLGAGAALLIIFLIICGEKSRRARVRGAAFFTLGVLALLCAAAAWMLTSDFSGVFLRFHEALFSNDLWLLDPRTDAMIRMLPQQFFEKIACWSLLAMGGCALIAPAAALIYGRKKL